MSVQFVSCNDEACPFNEDRQCRAVWMMVDEDGKCAIRSQPHDQKSETESYVDLKECRCESCDNWEFDEFSKLGQCGLRTDLHFQSRKKAEDEVGPYCYSYEKQIREPGPFDGAVNI